ncbi:hypothetical protein V1477_000668 [Vespula maculifrons]|uniref:Uncharacterized protein n=1 Tax=Vespula maculifrons TaxID=7453 RepID=A0ABD2D3H3_VESMC
MDGEKESSRKWTNEDKRKCTENTEELTRDEGGNSAEREKSERRARGGGGRWEVWVGDGDGRWRWEMGMGMEIGMGTGMGMGMGMGSWRRGDGSSPDGEAIALKRDTWPSWEDVG